MVSFLCFVSSSVVSVNKTVTTEVTIRGLFSQCFTRFRNHKRHVRRSGRGGQSAFFILGGGIGGAAETEAVFTSVRRSRFLDVGIKIFEPMVDFLTSVQKYERASPTVKTPS